MILATLAAGSTAAGAATSAAGAAKQSVRTIGKGLTLSFPTNQRVGTVNGVQSPEFRAPESEGGEEGLAAAGASGPQRFRKRASGSLSVRPTSRTAPARAAAAGLSVPNVKPTPVDTAQPGLRRSFEGLNHFDQRTANNGNQFSIEPPDQGLCVGNGFVLETINTVLQVFDARGNALSPVTDLNSFYGYPAQINRTTGAQGPFITDPSCLFDKATNRFFHVVLTLEVDPATGALLGPNHLDIAVSQTSSPLGAWNIYQLPVQDDGTQGTPTHVDCPCIGDYPHIGADKFGFYITTNEYPLSDDPGLYGNNYNGAQIYAFSKAALAAGAASVNVVQFESPELGDGTPSFTVWPAQFNPGGFVTSANGTEYFLQTSAAEETLNEEGMDKRVGFWTPPARHRSSPARSSARRPTACRRCRSRRAAACRCATACWWSAWTASALRRVRSRARSTRSTAACSRPGSPTGGCTARSAPSPTSPATSRRRSPGWSSTPSAPGSPARAISAWPATT
jgi:hypothetical protein